MPAELDIVAAENRRLVREVKELRARVSALESSRWWRLHPRFLLSRLRPHVSHEDPAASVAAPKTASPPTVDSLTARFHDEVVARGSFRSDMVSGNFHKWERFLTDFEGRAARILEIGSFEGMSACYFLWRLPDARLTCIDTFTGGPSFAALGADVGGIEAAFDRNVALVDGERVCKLVGDAEHHLMGLLDDQEEFDLVFVDGSDLALDVLVDAALSWQVLVPGGVMIFDNYLWRSPLGEDPLFHPAPAIEAFLGLVHGHCEVIAKDSQVVIRRLAATNVAQGATEIVAAGR